MHLAMNINFENPTLLYGLFFSLAHIASWAILLYYGHKHKYPTFRWLLIIVTGYIFFTIGTHVLAVNVENLKLFLIGDGWQASSGKSLIGGLLFAIPAMLLVKNLVGFKAAIFEPYAFTLPIGIALQRVGCLAAGCCYGNESDFPWAISYKYGHFLHYTQWRQGLVSGSEQSIPLHPVQIYEGILCLMIAALVYYFYKRKRTSYSII